MSTLPQVTAIIVNWNGAEVLPETLASLARSDYPRLHGVVVDNASRDDSAREVTPPLELLQLAENRGYAAALNEALAPRLAAEACPDYFLLLNNDVVLAEDLISKLVKFAEQIGPGIFGPQVRLYRDPSRLDAAWGEVRWHHVLARYHGAGADAALECWNQVRQVPLLLGSVLLVHRKVFQQTGLFDERFFMYHEEVDFLFRAARKGFPIYYYPLTQARHHSGHGTRAQPLKKTYWLRRNTVYFFRKHGAGPAAWFRFAATLTASFLFNLLRLQGGRAMAIARGAADGLRGGDSL